MATHSITPKPLSESCQITGIALRVLLRANTITLYQSTTHIILTFSPNKIYFREVKINQELVQNQQTFQVTTLTLLILLKQVTTYHTIICNRICPFICGVEQLSELSGNFLHIHILQVLVQLVIIHTHFSLAGLMKVTEVCLVVVMAIEPILTIHLNQAVTHIPYPLTIQAIM